MSFAAPGLERCGERQRITSLLEAASGFNVRVVCAPLGSGKSTALKHYITARAGAYFDVRALMACSPGDVALTFDLPPRLSQEIVIDNVDAAPAAAIDALIERIVAGDDKRHYILSGRSRQRMHVSRVLASGLGTLVDGNTLAFTMAEAAQLADQHRLRYDDDDLAQLLHDTDAWPIVVHWIVRSATSGGHLRGAFESWRQSRGHLLLEYLAAEHRSLVDEYLRFMVLLRRGLAGAGEALERFEALGFPIVRSRTALRPHRVLSGLANAEAAPLPVRRPATHPLMTFKVLGRFRCEIDGREIAFVRRRDQNVLTFVALSENGRATVCGAAIFLPDSAIAIYTFAHQAGPISRFLARRFFVQLGEASFAFYITHGSVLWAVALALPNASTFERVVLSFAATLLLSFGLLYAVEIPCRSRLRNTLSVADAVGRSAPEPALEPVVEAAG